MVPPNGAERQQNTGFISEGIKLVNQPHPALKLHQLFGIARSQNRRIIGAKGVKP
jgi:hypothetical protein